MSNLTVKEIKAFVPAKDFALSKQFYKDLGFTMASDEHGVAFFHHGNCSFLLQDFYEKALAENLMMHMLVEDVRAWHQQVISAGLKEKYGTVFSEVTEQPWRMLDFHLHEPSGVLWRFGQNV